MTYLASSRNFFIVSGGPGSGKTTLLSHLQSAGAATAPEAGRAIIRAQTAIGGPARPDHDPALYAELMLSWDLRSYEEASSHPGNVFFDRGVPDTLGYLRLVGQAIPSHMWRAAEAFRYNEAVFMLPPWPEIYAPDTERKQTLDDAERTFEALRQIYLELDYRPVLLPRSSVEERVKSMLAAIDDHMNE
ncbi:AAA family ATPase [Chelativorans sp. YIM 93263]|uniref:AAA family ATPase n=1 Tax=Chelativorans sp. YIM 93263 TaxID=2906648 RepID=UPI0023787BBF|nr:AAA family ATPase [Chelativorans sp. YIM 93263]